MKTCPSFVCWQCKRTFGQVVDLTGDPVLLLECPYCSAACKLDLGPYKQRIVEVMKDGKSGPGEVRYQLPARVPTSEPGDEALAQGYLGGIDIHKVRAADPTLTTGLTVGSAVRTAGMLRPSSR